MPWPYSTFPTWIVTCPSWLKSSHRASTGLAARSVGSEEAADGAADPSDTRLGEADGGVPAFAG